MEPQVGPGAAPSPGSLVPGGPTPSLPRSEVPSSRSSMVDSASEMSESDTDAMSLSGISGFSDSNRTSRQRIQVEELTARVNTLNQENRVLKIEVDKFKIQTKILMEDNKKLRQDSVNIQARAEQEEEFISNTLLKKIQELKKEKETLAIHYEKEEEFLTNQLSKKMSHLKQEKVELERTLEREQEYQVNKLMRRIERLERETHTKHTSLDQLRREKVELENTLEKEQEALVNRLWKKLDRLEYEKRHLQVKLNETSGSKQLPRSSPRPVDKNDSSEKVASHVKTLKQEVEKLRKQLAKSSEDHTSQMKSMENEEKSLREENLRLQRKLHMEVERREALHRHLSESETSLEMEEERDFNQGQFPPRGGTGNRLSTSPGPYIGYTSAPNFIPAPNSAFTPPSPYRGQQPAAPSAPLQRPSPQNQRPASTPAQVPDRFVKPSPPPSPGQNRSKE